MSWLERLLDRRRYERQLEAELGFHLESQVADNLRAGMTEREARRQALVQFGGLEQIKEQCRDERFLRLVDETIHDLRFAMRSLRNNPGFAIAAVLTLALGIGANTAVFSVVSAVILRPLPVPDPGRVVVFLSADTKPASPLSSEITFHLWRQQSSVFEDVAGFAYATVNFTGPGEPRIEKCVAATADYFRLFALPIARGRVFTPEEELPSGPKAVMVSDDFWKTALGGDPAAVGKTISINGTPTRVVGVMAPGAEAEDPEPPDIWEPLPMDPAASNPVQAFVAVGRLKRGVTMERANAQLQIATQEFRRNHPKGIFEQGTIFSVEPLQNLLVQNIRLSLLLLSAAVGLVLLIACTNATSLVLARFSSRTREMAIRAALGATTGRIARQCFTESVLLAATGGILGLCLGLAGIRALLTLVPTDVPRLAANGANLTADWRVLTFTGLITLFSSAAVGLLPVLRVSNTRAYPQMGGARSGQSFRQTRMRSVLFVGQAALATVLLIGAGLLIRTLILLHAVDPGFDAHHVVRARVQFNPQLARVRRTSDAVHKAIETLDAVPGVENAAFANGVPLDGPFAMAPIIVAGRPLSGPAHGSSHWFLVSPSFRNLLRIPLVTGRWFNEEDRSDSPQVAVINQAMARTLWPGGDPIGARIFIGKGLGALGEDFPRTIVGVVGDVHYDGLGSRVEPLVYVPIDQHSDTVAHMGFMLIQFRDLSAAAVAAARKQLQQTLGVPVPPPGSLESVVVQSTVRQRFNMVLMSGFGTAALLLAAIGLYGVLAYSVKQRTPEMAVRLAMGAGRGRAIRMVVWQGLQLTLMGIAIGLIGAAALTRSIATFLFGVKPMDLLTFISVPIVLVLNAGISAWLPARRAARIRLSEALRWE
ncbi:MAG TPA: ABC transporter permease [Bryobacteraceae bacterium]|nr:ABC transporter permease [Bryobacteraceae bacterium]